MILVRTFVATLAFSLLAGHVSAQETSEAVIPVPASASCVAPERQAGLFELELGLDTGVALPRGRNAVSLLGRAGVTYRGSRRYYVRGTLGPSGGVGGEPQRVTTGAFTAGFDSRFVEVGGGAGVARSAAPCEDATNCDRRERSQPSPMLLAELRIGARDGLHLASRLSGARIEGRMRIAIGELSLHVPVSERVGAYASVTLAADAIGYRRFETGVRIRARGDGGAGSVYVTPGTAWTGYALDALDDEMYVNAFSAVFSVEYRL